MEEAGVKVPEGQIGKKKMAKLQQKAEKKKVAGLITQKYTIVDILTLVKTKQP